ncbi:MAG: hypothetical protein M3533_10920 [Actinomycetota bacterium]|nr:hypothetical protein [Actinomycetota bacterium]
MESGRFTGPALVAGGCLWVAMYLLELAIGPLGPGGMDPSSSSLEWLAAVLFGAAILSIGFGLLGLRERLAGRSRKLGIAACVPVALAMCCAAVNLVLLAGVVGEARVIGALGGLGVVGTLLGATMMAAATLRARALAAWARAMLLVAGIVTFPVILLTIPLEAVLPPHVIGDLPFPVAGLAFAAVGLSVVSSRRRNFPAKPDPTTA